MTPYFCYVFQVQIEWVLVRSIFMLNPFRIEQWFMNTSIFWNFIKLLNLSGRMITKKKENIKYMRV